MTNNDITKTEVKNYLLRLKNSEKHEHNQDYIDACIQKLDAIDIDILLMCFFSHTIEQQLNLDKLFIHLEDLDEE